MFDLEEEVRKDCAEAWKDTPAEASLAELMEVLLEYLKRKEKE